MSWYEKRIIRWNNNTGPQIYFFQEWAFIGNKKAFIEWNKKDFIEYKDVLNWTVFAVSTSERGIPYMYDNIFLRIPQLNDTYLNNFINTLPLKAKLYFDSSSEFPRTKLHLSEYKKVLSCDKADAIVLKQLPVIKPCNLPYCIFTDQENIYAITDEKFNEFFNCDLNVLEENVDLFNMKFQNKLSLIYRGMLEAVMDPADTFEKFNNHIYNKPFILDNDLDYIINNTLIDPDLDSIKNIYEMLNSPDINTVKLGALMAAGFNVNKWRLTFTLVLGLNLQWQKISSVVLKQLYKTLDFKHNYSSLYNLCDTILSQNIKYNDEDIKLAKEFARTIPEIKAFCSKQPFYYSDSLPFIPDEYLS